jgi:metal-responsive CopG/Arc/MetJ family transcriptional regulator
MREIQLIIESELLNAIDEAVTRLDTTRSAFIRQALQDALQRLEIADLEERHRRGYEKYPVETGEFDF